MKFILTQNWLSRQWRWKLITDNNRSIAVSGESYHNRGDCLRTVQQIMGEVAEATVRLPIKLG